MSRLVEGEDGNALEHIHFEHEVIGNLGLDFVNFSSSPVASVLEIPRRLPLEAECLVTAKGLFFPLTPNSTSLFKCHNPPTPLTLSLSRGEWSSGCTSAGLDAELSHGDWRIGRNPILTAVLNHIA